MPKTLNLSGRCFIFVVNIIKIYYYVSQSLYINTASFLKIFSERFLVKISKEGFSNYIEKLHNNCTIFTVSFECLSTNKLFIDFTVINYNIIICMHLTVFRLYNRNSGYKTCRVTFTSLLT